MHIPLEILLVEDNPYDAELTLRALKKYNLANHIVHLSDGEQALDFLFHKGEFASHARLDKPRVILLDIKLPRVSGIEVLRIIKQDPELKKIPVVMLTSSREQADIVESYNLGVNSYIVKPVEFDKFMEAIKEIGLYWLLLNQPPD
ncbi:MAG: response regulator [Bacteroidales bacterium]